VHITGATSTYALLGKPVGHSGSPALHNGWFERAGVDAVYVALETDRADRAIGAVRALGLAGANLTIPLKRGALDHVDRVSPVAACVGAINTLYWRDGLLWGDNTDAKGFVDALQSAHGLAAIGNVAVLGVGGAGRAVAAGLAQAGAATVHLLNRTPARARGAAEHLSSAFPAAVFQPGPLTVDYFRGLAGSLDVVVCCVSGAGASLVAALPTANLRPTAVWCDVNYWMDSPPQLRELAMRGHRVLDGAPMLAGQAARSYQLWTGLMPPT